MKQEKMIKVKIIVSNGQNDVERDYLFNETTDIDFNEVVDNMADSVTSV